MMARHPFSKNNTWDEWSSTFTFAILPRSLRVRFLQKMLIPLHETKPGCLVTPLQDRTTIQNAEFVLAAKERGLLNVLPTSIQEFRGKGHTVLLKNGIQVEADVCVLATGFDPKYPFLGKEVLGSSGLKDLTLHRYMVGVEEETWGLNFVFTTSVNGSGIVTAEMEARWLVHQIAGGKLESEKQRLELSRRTELHAQPFKGFILRNTFDVVDSLARDLGCQPRPLANLLSTSPRRRRLAAALTLGPWLPQHYRLLGPHAKPELAEKAILDVTKNSSTWRMEALTQLLNVLYYGGTFSIAACLLRSSLGSNWVSAWSQLLPATEFRKFYAR